MNRFVVYIRPSTSVTPEQTQRVPKGPAPLPFPEPRNPVDPSQINLNILSTGASRGDCGG